MSEEMTSVVVIAGVAAVNLYAGLAGGVSPFNLAVAFFLGILALRVGK